MTTDDAIYDVLSYGDRFVIDCKDVKLGILKTQGAKSLLAGVPVKGRLLLDHPLIELSQ